MVETNSSGYDRCARDGRRRCLVVRTLFPVVIAPQHAWRRPVTLSSILNSIVWKVFLDEIGDELRNVPPPEGSFFNQDFRCEKRKATDCRQAPRVDTNR